MKNEELDLVKTAIINEIEGYEFYNMAAEQTENSDAKKAFKELADEEFLHVNWLKEIYSRSGNIKEDSLYIALVSDPPSPHIFNWDNIDRKSASIAVSVFGIGIQIERASVEFYKMAYKSSDIKEVKELYKLLIKWETSHLEQFSNEYDKLRESWWSQQEFSPY